MNRPPQNQEEHLASLRARIDEIDARLRDGLWHRAALIAEIAEFKQASQQAPKGEAIIRPAREAQQMRALAAWYKETRPLMPLASFIAIWREIISAAVAQQAALTVYYHTMQDDMADMAARNQFGHAAHYEPCANAQDVIKAVKGAPDAVGVLPVQTGWWAEWARDKKGAIDGLFIFAGWPVLAARPQALCIGHLPPVPSGFDVTVLIGAAENCPPEAEILAQADGIALVTKQGFVTEAEAARLTRAYNYKICGLFASIMDETE